eukprot:gene5781-6020_t
MSEPEPGLLLSEDCMGKLLPLLDPEDIQALLCVSKDWRQAGLRQLRVLSPLHLPSAPPASSFNSLETLQLPLVRHIGSSYTYNAPMREFDSISSFSHAAQLDLKGQTLPSYCCLLLSQSFPRLTALNLSTCDLEYESLQHLSHLTGLQTLNLAGELRLTWAAANVHLQLGARNFSSISKLTQLEALTLDMMTHGQSFEPYSLAPVAKTLKRLSLRCVTGELHGGCLRALLGEDPFVRSWRCSVNDSV